MALKTTCRFFAPSSQDAKKHNLVPGKTHKFLQLYNEACCWNPAKGATADQPVTCDYVAQMDGCQVYEPEAQKVLRRFMLVRDANLPVAMKPYLVLDLVETRLAIGVRTLIIRRYETDDPNHPTEVEGNDVHIFTSTELGDNLDRHAAEVLRQQMIGQRFEQIPAPTDEVKSSYFASIMDQYAERQAAANTEPLLPAL